jgi:uncharacterized protein
MGQAIADLNRGQGHFLRRSCIAVLLSDGWDCGAPEVLAREISRLRRCVHRVLWLNPLKADPGFAPLTQGMQATMPYVDGLLPGNSIKSVAEMADVLEEAL